MDAVALIADGIEPERAGFYEEHNQLMEEDSQYNAVFRKYQELAKSEEANIFSKRLDEIVDSTDNLLSENFLVCAEALKHVPFLYKTKQCEKQIMKSFDRKFGQDLS